MGTSKVFVALDEGIKILDEDERQRSTLSHDGIDVQQDINDDHEQEDEEDDQGEANIEVRRRRTRPGGGAGTHQTSSSTTSIYSV
ncbi:hypothetical protein Scep_012817 [Stephania cephalantha]|uniref:Uncharacterized protein n=1 Tax=Stephania cephalantha TaxID=152367 RepID=A0AAP0JFT3_9MAGN